MLSRAIAGTRERRRRDIQAALDGAAACDEQARGALRAAQAGTTLDVDPAELDFLGGVAPEQLRALRVAIYEQLFREDAELFGRVARLGRRLPPRLPPTLASDESRSTASGESPANTGVWERSSRGPCEAPTDSGPGPKLRAGRAQTAGVTAGPRSPPAAA